MKTRTKWVIAGGAAAFVLAPIAAVAGPSTLGDDIGGRGEHLGPADFRASGEPTPSADASPQSSDPTATRTASPKTPVSPKTPAQQSDQDSPNTPNTPNTPDTPNTPNTPDSPDSPE